MQEPLLIARLEERKFLSLSQVSGQNPEWQGEYPPGFSLSAVICILGGYVLYGFPWSPEFKNLHRADFDYSVWQFIVFWLIYLGSGLVLSLIISLFHRTQAGVNTRPAKKKGILELLSHIDSVRWPLRLCGGIALLLAIMVGFRDAFILHRFQAIPIALITILFSVPLWPFVRIFTTFLKVNIEYVWRNLRGQHIFKTVIADPSKDLKEN